MGTKMDINESIRLPLDAFNIAKVVPTAFIGATANGRGDKDGTGTPLTLFKVTGDVLVRIFGVCTTDLAGATGTVQVGVVGNTAALIALTTATDIDADKIWSDASPTLGVDTLASVLGPYIIVNGQDIIETVATADITSGNIYYICLWKALSPDGNVEAAV